MFGPFAGASGFRALSALTNTVNVCSEPVPFSAPDAELRNFKTRQRVGHTSMKRQRVIEVLQMDFAPGEYGLLISSRRAA